MRLRLIVHEKRLQESVALLKSLKPCGCLGRDIFNHRHQLPLRQIIRCSKMAIDGISTDPQSLASLTASLQRFGISSLPSFPNAYPTRNPVDIYRAHLAAVLAPVAGVTPEIVYPVLQRSTSLDKGDLTLPVPALRLKGKKPDEFAQQIAENVRVYVSAGQAIRLTLVLVP